MKRIFTLFITLLVFISCSVSVNAAEENEISVKTPVEMTLVSESDGNYEYSVSVDVTVTENSTAVEGKNVSILMFGSRDNTAFVSGNNILNLTTDEIAADYYVYYIDQTVSGDDGKATFDFNIILPSPAKADAYYVWVGAESIDSAHKLSTDKLSISTQIVAVTLVSTKTEAILGENITFSPDAVNIFGNSVPGVSFNYNITQDDVVADISIDKNTLYTSGMSGIYNITVTATDADGVKMTSNNITLSVDGTTLLGDPDGNKLITVQDAITILRHIAGISIIEGNGSTAGDIDRNGSIDTNDANNILRYLARLIMRF